MLRLGIVGSGGMGSSHAHGTNLAAPRCSLAWVADVDGDRAGQLADEVGSRAITDWTAGLDDVDAVTICTPTTSTPPRPSPPCAPASTSWSRSRWP